MRKTYLFSILVLTIFMWACSDSDTLEMESENEQVMEEDDLSQSPFKKFLGKWQISQETYASGSVQTTGTFMTIEEDENINDSFAKGIYEKPDSGINEEFTLELTTIENEIIIVRPVTTFYCTYNFFGDDEFELDDSTEDYTYIATWTREE